MVVSGGSITPQMLGFTQPELMQWLGQFLWPFLRITGLCLTAPLYGSSMVPPCQEQTSWWGDDEVIQLGWSGGRVCWEATPFFVGRLKQSLPDSLLWHYRNGWRMLFGS